VAGTCECGNEPYGSIKCVNFFTNCKPVSFSEGLCSIEEVSRSVIMQTVLKVNTFHRVALCFELPDILHVTVPAF